LSNKTRGRGDEVIGGTFGGSRNLVVKKKSSWTTTKGKNDPHLGWLGPRAEGKKDQQYWCVGKKNFQPTKRRGGPHAWKNGVCAGKWLVGGFFGF